MKRNTKTFIMIMVALFIWTAIYYSFFVYPSSICHERDIISTSPCDDVKKLYEWIDITMNEKGIANYQLKRIAVIQDVGGGQCIWEYDWCEVLW